MRHEFDDILMRSNCRIVDFNAGGRESAISKKSWEFGWIFNEAKEIIKICCLTEVRADGIDEE